MIQDVYPSEYEDIRNQEVEIPAGWDYAASYPDRGENIIELGHLEYMLWTNEKAWKNFQRAHFVLFKEGPFLLEKE